ncbi:hypothetical protein P8452_56856 [Trifolium repens]|nr:hypothetical protein P8452_56856 [Trifolium repens]
MRTKKPWDFSEKLCLDRAPFKSLVIFGGETSQYLNGFVNFDSILRSGRISEVEVLKLFFCSREMSSCFQLFLLKLINQVSSFMSGKQVNEARARWELMMGAELGSSD